MKESMIHDLYFGNFSPWERERIRTQEYSTITKKIAAIVEHFKNLLSPEEYAKFAEMQNLQAEIDLIDHLSRTGCRRRDPFTNSPACGILAEG